MKLSIRGMIQILLLFSLFLGTTQVEANHNQEIRVYVDGNNISFSDTEPYIDRNNRTLGPIRLLAEALGAEVLWNNERKEVTIKKDKHEVILRVNKRDYLVDGQIKQMDTEMVYNPLIGRTYAPIRYVTESLGAEVEWEKVDHFSVIHIFTFNHTKEEKKGLKERVKQEILMALPKYESGLHDYKPFFAETFNDKTLKNNRIINYSSGKTIWTINSVKDQENRVTESGALELAGAQYMQKAVLIEGDWKNHQNYAMEFTINVQKLGNAGHNERPVAVIIPRSKDKALTEYYAVTYFLETKQMGAIVANLYQAKWAIINTAAPTKMEPLVEGYFMLRENVDYTGRLIVNNTPDGNVNIQFYIDGPIHPMEEYKPLLEYTDSSPYKILTSATGPAFGMTGYSDDGWGYSPSVQYDNIKLFDLQEFKNYESLLKKYVSDLPEDITTNQDYDTVKYLINKGTLGTYTDHTFRGNNMLSIAEFLAMLVASEGEKYPLGVSHWAENYIKRAIELGMIKDGQLTDYDVPISKFQVAQIITSLKGNKKADKRYLSFIKETIPTEFINDVHYTFQEGYLRLDENFRFNGSQLITRQKAATILLRVLDDGLRKVNYDLELPHIFSSGAILQRNKSIPVWGRGFSGDTITVTFKNQKKTTVVENGHWYLELDPEPHGGPYTLTVTSTTDSIVLKDILVGEVFIVAGQSNAEMYTNECYGAEDTKKKLVNKMNLRYYTSEQLLAVTPNFTSKGEWTPAYDWMIDWSPAIGTFFVEKILELNEELKNVPIGIIPLTYGGSTIELFMPHAIIEEQNFVQKDNEPIMSGYWNGFWDAVAPFSVKGMMYYQGENSTQLGYEYEAMLRDFLRGIRIEFKDSNLPVMLVQLSGYGENYYQSDLDSWPIIREIQMRVAKTTEHTGLVTAIDLADENPFEIHPKEKKKISQRLVYLAMKMIYGIDLEQESPEIKDFLLEGNKFIVSFKLLNSPLYFKEGVAKGFEVLDSKGTWHDANAKINPDQSVEIWHDEILSPLGVRYAWRNYPDISLFDSLDYPALPFNTTIDMESDSLGNTSEHIIKTSFHGLQNEDGIVNASRNNIFRMITRLDKNRIYHEYPIKDQTAGDTIYLFSRDTNAITEIGTTETIIKMTNHGLSEGDWIRNNTRGWEPRRVKAVLDKDTIEVEAIKGQRIGDDIERYIYKKTIIAEE